MYQEDFDYQIDEEVRFINENITYDWAMQEEVLFNVNKILKTQCSRAERLAIANDVIQNESDE